MYFARVMWWNELEEKTVTTAMFVFTDTYEEATKYIVEAFDNIESINIEEFDSEERHIIYIPEEVIQQVKEENLY